MASLHSEIRKLLTFLKSHPDVRSRIAAPPDKTIVYSGDMTSPAGVSAAWRLLEQAKKQDPQRFDYVTLEERLRTLHVPRFGETIFEHAMRIARQLASEGVPDNQAVILWRALSGIYVQGAVGKVRALIFPGPRTPNSVFSLTEVNVLLKPSVLAKIDIDRQQLEDFRMLARAGVTQPPIVIF
ncbi:MAG: hypothetical protein HKN49_01505 [Gammaproteobacteria bacterium]|nr:hypothetical protein [Gammaproteobacteria bacterium]